MCIILFYQLYVTHLVNHLPDVLSFCINHLGYNYLVQNIKLPGEGYAYDLAIVIHTQVYGAALTWVKHGPNGTARDNLNQMNQTRVLWPLTSFLCSNQITL